MRKIIHIFLSLVIVYASTTSAYANTSIGGWTALDTITAGATNTINAVKGAGATGMRSAVAVAPSAVKVGKHLIKGGGSAALAFAMVELADGAIDWVLDPANNAVRVTRNSSDDVPMTDKASIIMSMSKYEGDWYFQRGHPIEQIKATTPEAVCRAYLSNNPYYNYAGIKVISFKEAQCYKYDKPYKPPALEPVIELIPIDTVAAKVIANAEAGHADSQEAVKATALEGFAAGEHDAALDAAAVPDTGVENPPDTENPPKDPDAPAEPFDPAGIISAINALKALLAGILSSITGLADIFNSDPPPEKTQKETDVPVDDLPPTKGASDFDVNYINFGGQCPVLPSFDVGIGGASSALTFDMTPLCDMAVKIRPAVIAIAYFIGLGVIASAIRET